MKHQPALILALSFAAILTNLHGQSIVRPKPKQVQKYYAAARLEDTAQVLTKAQHDKAMGKQKRLLKKLSKYRTPEIQPVAAAYWRLALAIRNKDIANKTLWAYQDSAMWIERELQVLHGGDQLPEAWYINRGTVSRRLQELQARIRELEYRAYLDKSKLDGTPATAVLKDCDKAAQEQERLATIAENVEPNTKLADMLDLIGRVYWIRACSKDTLDLLATNEKAELLFATLDRSERQLLKQPPYAVHTAAFFELRRSGGIEDESAPSVDLVKIKGLPKKERAQAMAEMARMLATYSYTADAMDFFLDLQAYWDLDPCVIGRDSLDKAEKQLDQLATSQSLESMQDLRIKERRDQVLASIERKCPTERIIMPPGVPIPLSAIQSFVENEQYSFTDGASEAPIVFIAEGRAVRYRQVIDLYGLGNNPSLERYLFEKIIAFNNAQGAEDPYWEPLPTKAQLNDRVNSTYLRVPTLDALGLHWVTPGRASVRNPIAAYRE